MNTSRIERGRRATANRFTKFVGNNVTAKLEIGTAPHQFSIEDLQGILELYVPKEEPTPVEVVEDKRWFRRNK